MMLAGWSRHRNEALADYRSRHSGGSNRFSWNCLRGYGDQLGNLIDDHRHNGVDSHLSGDTCDMVEVVARTHLQWPALRRDCICDREMAFCNSATGWTMSVIAMLRQSIYQQLSFAAAN